MSATPPAPTVVPAELLGPVVAYFNPRRVILFGSLARGEADADSDIDLLVVVDDDTPAERMTPQARFEARKSYRRATDLVLCREAVFRQRSSVVGSLAHAIATEGVVVYDRP